MQATIREEEYFKIRRTLAVVLLAASVFVGWIGSAVAPSVFEWVIRAAAGLGVMSGIILLRWAHQETLHLQKPYPEKSPSILRRD